MKSTDWQIAYRLSWIACAVGLFVLVGCGVKTNLVKGTVAYPDGTPMPGGGQVIFNPTDPSSRVSSRGIIKEDGSFQMGTAADTDGAPEGHYQVAVVSTPTRDATRRPPLQKKYTNQKTSGLEFTVKRGKNEFNIVVEK